MAKNPASTPPAQPRGTLYRVAIVGAATLKGNELKDALEEAHFPAADIRLLDDEESIGQLEAVGDEPTFIQPIRPEQFDAVDLVFFASAADSTRRYWKYAHQAGCAVVDVSYGLEDEPEAKAAIRSPWIEREMDPYREKVSGFDLRHNALVAAHPAATMLGLLLLRIERLREVRRAVATVFGPVSEEGKRGMDELHQQTLNLLSFQPLPKTYFDVQVAFNIVSRFGQDAKTSLSAAENRIYSHLRHTTNDRFALPAIQVLQAPTFHSHAVSLYVEFAEPVRTEEVTEALHGDHISISEPDDDAPNNVNAAGQPDILVGLRPDVANQAGVWIWATADNLKLTGITAVECGSSLVAARTTGRIQ